MVNNFRNLTSITDYTGQCPCEVDSYSSGQEIPPIFMEPKDCLPLPKEPATDPYQNHSNPNQTLRNLISFISNLIV